MTIDELEQRLNADYHDMTTQEIAKAIDKINALKAIQERDNKL